jgi:hypothetical protein
MEVHPTASKAIRTASSMESRLSFGAMNSRPTTLLALLALLVLGGLGTSAWWLLGRSKPDAPRPVDVLDTHASAVPDAGQKPPEKLENVQPVQQGATPAGFPIEVDLELVLADQPSDTKGATPLGSAATARLKGSVISGVNTPVGAEVRFEAGPNQGRLLQCDATGRFGATNLFPGRAVLRVSGPGIPGSRRVVLLRQKTETELNIGYGRLTEITGEVFARDQRPLAGAKVSFDGQDTTSDEAGVFHFDGVASGQALVVVELAGYASIQEELTVPAAKKIEKGQLKYVLEKGGTLEIDIPGERSNVEALCYILADVAPGTQRSYPWFLVNPVHIYPGGSTTVHDLPAGSFTLRVFLAGAMAKPPTKSARLDIGGTAQVTLGLEPGPRIHGLVRLNGQPVQHAEVTLEAADRLGATLTAFGAPNEFFVETEVLPDAPPAFQRAFSDAAGTYEVSSWESVARERYLVARYDNGRQVASKFLKGGESEVDLDLHSSGGGDGLLRIVLGERQKDLPVRVTINGEPRPPLTLPAGQDLRVGELNRGRWKLSLRYNGATLAAGKEVEVGAETALPIELPK